jgi:hypothetical protein
MRPGSGYAHVNLHALRRRTLIKFTLQLSSPYHHALARMNFRQVDWRL